jgi:nitric oxide dioxygenase
MQEKDVDLVQSSFKKVVPIADKAAEIFYARLFELDPDLKKLFKTDLKEQGKKLMATLGMVVMGLKDLAKIVPAAEALAVRHIGYGVKEEDYTTVGNALLYTLKTGLGDDFTPEVRAAWVEAYTLLSRTMKDAARKAA